jgi:hypothetical protein
MICLLVARLRSKAYDLFVLEARGSMSKTERKIRKSAPLVPELVRTARLVHEGEPRPVLMTAVLAAWCGLAGASWNPQMVKVVEQELGS